MSERDLLTIGELANETGKSAHTLRYYERIGLMPLVGRSPSGHRRYNQDHLTWVLLLDRLRQSGMSIKRMQEYAELVRAGRNNLGERRRILRQHLADIETRIEALEECANIVRSKIHFYAQHRDDDQAIWTFPGLSGSE